MVPDLLYPTSRKKRKKKKRRKKKVFLRNLLKSIGMLKKAEGDPGHRERTGSMELCYLGLRRKRTAATAPKKTTWRAQSLVKR